MMNVVLVQPQIPPNTGTIARLCVSTQTRLHLIKPLAFDISDKAIQRAGLDYWPYLDLSIHTNFEEFYRSQLDLHLNSDASKHTEFKNRLFFFSKKGKKTLWEASYPEDSYLIFGSEQTGLPEEILSAYFDRLFYIPMSHPKIRSLNLALSSGIALFEALRQNNSHETDQVHQYDQISFTPSTPLQ